MHVGAVNNNYTVNQNNIQKPCFKTLIKDNSVLPIINKMSKQEKHEFEQIEKRLSKTKFWDLKISSIGDAYEEFKFYFVNKKQQHGIIADGVFPYEKQGDTIKIYSIVYGPENTSRNIVEALKFKSARRADEVYNKYLQNLEMIRSKQFNLTPIEALRNKEFELSMLEESSKIPKKNHNLTLMDTDIQTKNVISKNVDRSGLNLIG